MDRKPPEKRRHRNCVAPYLSSFTVLNSFRSDFFECMGTRLGLKVFTLFFGHTHEQAGGWGQKICHQKLFNIPKLSSKWGRWPSEELGFSGSGFSEKHYFNGPICQPGITHRVADFSDRMEFPSLLLVLGRKAGKIWGNSSCCDWAGVVLLALLEIILITTGLLKPPSNSSSGGCHMACTTVIHLSPSPANENKVLIIHATGLNQQGFPYLFPPCSSSAGFLTVAGVPLLAPLLPFGKNPWRCLWFYFLSFTVDFLRWPILIESFQGIPLGVHKSSSLFMVIFHYMMFH